MRHKKFSNRVKALSNEKKILGLAAVISLVSCFLPWYGINSRVINEWWNAFGSIGSVAGYMVMAFSIAALAIIMLPVIKPGIDLQKRLPVQESSLLMFLFGQSFFTTLLFIPVYAQYSLINATNSGTRFGIYITLVSSLVATLVAIGNQRKGERLEMVQQDFATVPRAQRSIAEWDEEESEEEAAVEAQGFEQEEMFVGAQRQATESPQEASQPLTPEYPESSQDDLFR